MLASFFAYALCAAPAPDWLLARNFAEARVFVLPDSALQLQDNLDSVYLLDGTGSVNFVSTYAAQLGLKERLQLDMAFLTVQGGILGALQVYAEDLTLHWAWADWGVYAGNPTVAVRLSRQHSAAPWLEAQVRLGDGGESIRWLAGAAFRRDLLGVAMTQTYILFGAVAYERGSVSVGAEARLLATDLGSARLTPANWVARLGPSVQYRPVAPWYVQLTAYGGVMLENDDNSRAIRWFAEPTFFSGWTF